MSAALIISLLLFTGDPYYNNNRAQAASQTTTAAIISPDLAKVLIDNAIQALQNGDINKTVIHIKAADLELAVTGNYYYYPSIQALSKLLEKDIIQALQNGDTNTALVYLNVADQQLGILLENLLTAYITIPKDTFLMYTNPTYGIKVQYRYNWIIEGTNYPAGIGGVQIASFYLSTVSDGLPFIRVGIDNLTKEFPRLPAVSILDYLKESLKDKNSTGFPGFKLIESIPISKSTLIILSRSS